MYFAAFLALLLLVVFLIIALFAIYPLKVAAVFNSEQQPDIHIMLAWLNPFLKAFITRHDNHATLTLNLFNKRVMVRDLSLERGAGLRLIGRSYMNYIDMARSIEINRADLYASYGFADPSVTGMLYAVIGIISQYIRLDKLYNNADFFSEHGYFNISAEAEINALVSLVRILRRNRQYSYAHIPGGNR